MTTYPAIPWTRFCQKKLYIDTTSWRVACKYYADKRRKEKKRDLYYTSSSAFRLWYGCLNFARTITRDLVPLPLYDTLGEWLYNCQNSTPYCFFYVSSYCCLFFFTFAFLEIYNIVKYTCTVLYLVFIFLLFIVCCRLCSRKFIAMICPDPTVTYTPDPTVYV
jgi:hypothetical protein